MKICVTQKEIDEGNAAQCPLERAFAREGLDTAVGPEEVSFFVTGSCLVTLPLPPAAVDFVAAFDDEDDPQPFEFELAIPREVFQEAA